MEKLAIQIPTIRRNWLGTTLCLILLLGSILLVAAFSVLPYLLSKTAGQEQWRRMTLVSLSIIIAVIHFLAVRYLASMLWKAAYIYQFRDTNKHFKSMLFLSFVMAIPTLIIGVFIDGPIGAQGFNLRAYITSICTILMTWITVEALAAIVFDRTKNQRSPLVTAFMPFVVDAET